MRESRVWAYLESHLPPTIQVERFEVMHPPGGSDCFWTDTAHNVSGWLELKYCEPNDRELARGYIPKLKQAQPHFLRRMAAKGVPSGILMRIGEDRWNLWRATGEHEWVSMIKSPQAFENVGWDWTGRLPVAELFARLRGE